MRRLPAVIPIFLAALAMAGCQAKKESGSAPPAPAADVAAVVKNRAPLQPNAFYPLPTTSIRPSGWLRRQLRIQADGLSGHLDEFWPSVDRNTSGWRGGKGESWERGPYYVDGLVPLAFLLGDQRLITKAKEWVEWTLQNQRLDGSIGPPSNKDWWPAMVMLKALSQYSDATHDPRVVPLMEKYLLYHLEHARERPLKDWGASRWADEVLSIEWVYNRTGNPRLLELAKILAQQGFDWKAHYANFQFPGKVDKAQQGQKTHVVNNAMAMKTSAVYWLVSGDYPDKDAIYRLLQVMDRYHLMPSGVHSGDEHYAGSSPVQGTELCAVVEGMFSIENLIAILGDVAFGDRLERIAYNALPGTFTKDMWAHQYDQQPNQILCSRYPRHWSENGPDSNLFGLEPNFGCCTANMHQGWPKLVASLWMATPDDGLAAVAYGPNEVTAQVRGGVAVRIQEETEYPFRDAIRMKVTPASPVSFPLVLRIPGWAAQAKIRVNDIDIGSVPAGTYHRIERDWKAGDVVDISLPMAMKASRWYNQSIALERGPLVFSLKIGEEWKKLKDQGMSADWEVSPTTPWNYGLIVDTEAPGKSVQIHEKEVGDYPFSPEGAPVEVRVKAVRLPEWKMEDGSAAPPPQSPVMASGPVETVTLIPYGSAKLRITEFPEVRAGSADASK